MYQNFEKSSNRLAWKEILKIPINFFIYSFLSLIISRFILPSNISIYFNWQKIICFSSLITFFVGMYYYYIIKKFKEYFISTEKIEISENPLLYYKQIELDYKAFMDIKLKQIELIKSFAPITIFLYILKSLYK